VVASDVVPDTTIEDELKFVPVSVNVVSGEPAYKEFGVMLVSVGLGFVTETCCVEEPPPEV
jgi:hypothetical protein